MLNKVRVGNIDDDVENLLKARFICPPYENYTKDAFMYMQKMKRNTAVLNDFPGKLYTIEANNRFQIIANTHSH